MSKASIRQQLKQQTAQHAVALMLMGITVIALASANVLAASNRSSHVANALPRCSWQEIERQLRVHRQRVRMCGPLSAARVLRLLGYQLNVDPWIDRFRQKDLMGTTIRDVVQMCRQFEPDTRAVSEANLSSLSLPCILLVNQSQHCIVAEAKTSAGRIRVWDPSDLKQKMIAADHLKEIWDGDAIVLTPSVKSWKVDPRWIACAGLWVTLAVLMNIHHKKRCDGAAGK